MQKFGYLLTIILLSTTLTFTALADDEATAPAGNLPPLDLDGDVTRTPPRQDPPPSETTTTRGSRRGRRQAPLTPEQQRRIDGLRRGADTMLDLRGSARRLGVQTEEERLEQRRAARSRGEGENQPTCMGLISSRFGLVDPQNQREVRRICQLLGLGAVNPETGELRYTEQEVVNKITGDQIEQGLKNTIETIVKDEHLRAGRSICKLEIIDDGIPGTSPRVVNRVTSKVNGTEQTMTYPRGKAGRRPPTSNGYQRALRVGIENRQANCFFPDRDYWGEETERQTCSLEVAEDYSLPRTQLSIGNKVFAKDTRLTLSDLRQLQDTLQASGLCLYSQGQAQTKKICELEMSAAASGSEQTTTLTTFYSGPLAGLNQLRAECNIEDLVREPGQAIPQGRCQKRQIITSRNNQGFNDLVRQICSENSDCADGIVLGEEVSIILDENDRSFESPRAMRNFCIRAVRYANEQDRNERRRNRRNGGASTTSN